MKLEKDNKFNGMPIDVLQITISHIYTSFYFVCNTGEDFFQNN